MHEINFADLNYLIHHIKSIRKVRIKMDKKDELFNPENENTENTAENAGEEYDPEIYTLTDEEGNELNFALLGTLEDNGEVYKALVPVNEDGEEESEEYVILKCGVDDDGEEILETIEDDDEFDRIADIFDSEFEDILYDD